MISASDSPGRPNSFITFRSKLRLFLAGLWDLSGVMRLEASNELDWTLTGSSDSNCFEVSIGSRETRFIFSDSKDWYRPCVREKPLLTSSIERIRSPTSSYSRRLALLLEASFGLRTRSGAVALPDKFCLIWGDVAFDSVYRDCESLSLRVYGEEPFDCLSP